MTSIARSTSSQRSSRAAAVVVLGLGLGLVAAACSSSPSTATTDNGNVSSTTASETSDTGGSAKKVFKQDQTDIHIGTGETFAIRLPADPSVGDSWEMVSDPDDSFVKADGNSFKAEAGAPPGAAGQIEFKFKAKKPGTTTVTMQSCNRCGSSGTVDPARNEPPQRITFTITVG